MRQAKLGILMGVCLVAEATALEAAAEQTESRERFVCTSGAAQRFIDIYRLAGDDGRPGACRVDYTREGTTRQLWSARADYGYCVKQALGLVTKLSRGSYACKPQTGAEQPPPEAAR